MTAFMLFHSTIKDGGRFRDYAMAVPKTLEPFGGEVVLKGKSINTLAGVHRFENVGVLRFPNIERAHAWYESAAYQALVANRDQAADMAVVSYQEP